MSSAVISTPAAQGRLFVLDSEAVLESRPDFSALGEEAWSTAQPMGRRCYEFGPVMGNLAVAPAARLAVRPAPERAASGIAAIDALTGGFPRGCLTEICGPASSGRTTVLLAALAAATRRGEFCVVVDASDALDPLSVVAVGVAVDKLLWVRCGENSPQRHRDTEKKHQADHRLDQVLRATDLLLESGGFGMIILDLGDLPQQAARHIPLTTWFRFRRAIEHTSTILLAVEQYPIAGSCSSLLLKLGSARDRKLAVLEEEAPEGRKNPRSCDPSTVSQLVTPPHAQLLTGLEITAELICSRLDRKPSATVAFASKTAWAG